MGRRRERRVAASTERRHERVEPPSSTEPADSNANQNRKLFTIFIIFFLVSPAISIIVYRILYASRTDTPLRHDQIKTELNYQEILAYALRGRYSLYVYGNAKDKGKVTTIVRWCWKNAAYFCDDFYVKFLEHSKASENGSFRHFTNPVLAYITPWNSKGYELAQKFNSKFTHLSPVWYDLKSQGTKLVLEGRHNADKEWVSVLRMKGHAQVLPRVVLEVFPTELLAKKKQRNKAVDLIVKECKEMEYDGIVLESWSRWSAYGILQDPDMRTMALQFIRQLGQALHAASLKRESRQHLQLVYVIGPPYSEKLQEYDFGPEDLKSLSDAVDGFSLMTYDFSGPQHPGPNAPLKWIRSTLQLLLGPTGTGASSLARKIFIGINFYGNDFILSEGSGGGAITGRDYLSLLEQHRPSIQWEKNSAEHFFVYTDNKHVKHAVFYPSLLSISMRLEEARSWGAGISIWEIGQGMDYFFDLL